MKKPMTCIKRILCLVLCAVLCSFPAGCGRGEEPAPATTRPSGDIGNLNPPGQLPVVREADSLRVYISRHALVSSYEYGKNALTTWLQDRTGLRIEFQIGRAHV